MNRTVLAFALLPAVLAFRPLPVGAFQHPTQPNSAPARELVIGDVHVVNFRHADMATDGSTGRIIGEKTEIRIPDPKTRSILVVHADDVRTQRVKKDVLGVVDMTGNVWYRSRSETKDGVITLDGTAGHGLYHRATERIELTGGVQAAFTDSAHLAGPGHMSAGNVTIEVESQPYRYTFAGPPAVNRIQFTPLDKKKSGDVSDVTVSRYDSGVFQAGSVARFDGAETTADMITPKRRTSIHMRAEHIAGKFNAAGTLLEQAEAVGNVRYTLMRVNQTTQSIQIVKGTCGRASWDDKAHRASLSEDVRATITDPDSLQEPARIEVEHAVASTVEPYTYDLTGAPGRAQIVFTPKPKPPAKGTPSAHASPAPGAIRVTDFDAGKLIARKSAVMTGGHTVMFYSEEDSQVRLRVHSAVVTAVLTKDGALDSATAAGAPSRPGIAFEAEQTVPVKGVEKKTALQTVQGTALYLRLTSAEPPVDHRTDKSESAFVFQLNGPFHAAIAGLDEFDGPVNIVGAPGDSVILTPTPQGYAYALDSPSETVTIEGPPKQPAPEPTPASAPQKTVGTQKTSR